MQVGEPVSVAPATAPPPDTELVAELVSVTFKSGVKASHGKATITGPHWEQGKDAEIEDEWSAPAKQMRLPLEPYSKRAAVYLIKGKGTGEAMTAIHEVTVRVKITKSRNVSGDAQLIGKFWGLSIEGTCPTSAGEHTIIATIPEPPDEIRGYRGKIAWRLWVESAAISLSLGTTLAELYFILGPPSSAYATHGVWTEALRFLCGRVGVAGESDGKAVAARVTEYCHSHHRLRYDTTSGSSSYGIGPLGGTFELADYMWRSSSRCNCYDQAGAVQTLAGAVGVILVWLFLRPFGYIKATNLVGIGLCNNPFFKSDASKRLVADDSPERTAFGNHAFIATSALKILDACAGPHAASESPAQYLAASIDDNPRLYERRRWGPGRVSNIVASPGVERVT